MQYKINQSHRLQAHKNLTYEYKMDPSGLTFVEALLTVNDGNPVSSEAGGTMELTMVLVQLPIWPAHRFIVWFTVIQALTLPLTSLMVHHTVTP